MLSVIIPTYNERENIEELINRIMENKIKEEMEAIIVDDNSPDETWKIVEEIGRKNKFVRLLRRKKKAGLTSAVLDGVKISRGEKIIIMDADLSHPPEKLKEMNKYLENFDLVVGSRNISGGKTIGWSHYRKIVSSGAAFLSKIVLGIKCSDPMSGFFGIRKKIIQNTEFKTKGYKILLNILVDNPDIKIKEIPFVFEDRKQGKSKLGNQEIITYLRDLYCLRKN